MQHGRPVHQPTGDSHPSDPRRWSVLGVLVLALLVTSIDHTIINVALPQMVGDLDASAAQLQWIVAAYTVVFAGLLLFAGALGDRFGRRGLLVGGLAVFGAAAGLGMLTSDPAQLIVLRALMGVGAAAIMPTTLSVITTSFPPEDRPRAIGVWVGVAGGAILGLDLLTMGGIAARRRQRRRRARAARPAAPDRPMSASPPGTDRPQ